MDRAQVPGMDHEQLLRSMAEKHTNPLLRTAYVYLGDASQAQDIVQEVFLRAWKHMEALSRLEPMAQKAWLVKTAVNLCHDYCRSRWFRHTDRKAVPEDVQNEPSQPGPEENLMLMDVMRLPEKYRQAILLYYYQEMTVREAADVLGISHTLFSRRLKKAVGLMKTALAGGMIYEE